MATYMDDNVSQDIFQEKIGNLMERLEFVCTYLDDQLIICNSNFENTLKLINNSSQKVKKVWTES